MADLEVHLGVGLKEDEKFLLLLRTHRVKTRAECSHAARGKVFMDLLRK